VTCKALRTVTVCRPFFLPMSASQAVIIRHDRSRVIHTHTLERTAHVAEQPHRTPGHDRNPAEMCEVHIQNCDG
jgi:hypothetical protein